MTDPTQAAAGWYADPQHPGSERWWNGQQWTEHQRPAPFAAPIAPVAYQAPSYPGAGSYPAAYSTVAPVRSDIATGTVWIWLIVLLPLLSQLPLFLIDWPGFFESSLRSSLGSRTSVWTSSFSMNLWLPSLLAYPIIAAQVLFGWLDWRALKARGVDRPFHWAWIFLAAVVSNGVYVIGRGVVLKRRTGKGMGPVWAWIAVMVVNLLVAIGFVIYLINVMIPLFSTLSPGSSL
jgi:hypothetical protein